MDRLIEGARELGVELSSRQIQQFETYYHELVEWNKKINLTTITAHSSVQVRHFLDSLTVTLGLPAEEKEAPELDMIDVGTGAGFPGVPLKIVLPDLRLVLIEPTAKKTSFLRHLICVLELEDVEVLNTTAEQAARMLGYRERFPVVLSRAVAPLPTLAELTLPFCRIGGRFVAQKKGEIEGEIDRAKGAIAALGGELEQIKRIELDEFSDVRYLVIVGKMRPTPDSYPRRPGVPRRRPIQETNRHVA